MAKLPDDASQNPHDNIDQIRDILLGPQKRQNDQRFDQITSDLQKAREEAKTSAKDLREGIGQESAKLQQLLEQAQAAIRSELEVKVKNLEAANAALQQDVSGTKAKLQSEIAQVREQLSAELEKNVAALRDSNVSRETMAELLQEMAVRLRKVEFFEELTNAVSRKSGR